MARRTTDNPRRPGQAAGAPPPAAAAPAAAETGIRPWHLLLVATVLAMAVGVFATRGRSTVNAVAVAVAIGSVAWVASAVARTVAPLVAPDMGEQTEMVGGRTRAALEREKMLVLRSIKEVEFDSAMGKISDADFGEVAGRLRARAAGLLRQLDADRSGYRVLIERELSTRVGRPAASPPPAASAGETPDPPAPEPRACTACGTANDPDARFCKSCGARVEAAR